MLDWLRVAWHADNVTGHPSDKTLRDEFAMQYMDQRWEHLRVGMKYLEEDHVEAPWCAAYHYADLAMQAREPKKETDDDSSKTHAD